MNNMYPFLTGDTVVATRSNECDIPHYMLYSDDGTIESLGETGSNVYSVSGTTSLSDGREVGVRSWFVEDANGEMLMYSFPFGHFKGDGLLLLSGRSCPVCGDDLLEYGPDKSVDPTYICASCGVGWRKGVLHGSR